MSDRDKIIKAMECCAVGAECDHCWYSKMNKTGYEGCHQMHIDALALLKAQEPRLITNADFENKELVDSAGSMPAWIEYRHGEEWDEYNDGNDDGWSVVYQSSFESEFYRCWTSRPTDEQRKATPWETGTANGEK